MLVALAFLVYVQGAVGTLFALSQHPDVNRKVPGWGQCVLSIFWVCTIIGAGLYLLCDQEVKE